MGRSGPSAAAGQPATVTTDPSSPTNSPTRRAGSRSRRSHPGAALPRTIDAVLAVFASTQVAAVTDTVRQGEAAGSPVRGFSTWCSTRSPRTQRRADVLEVASPPAAMATVDVGPVTSSSGRPGRSWTRTTQPPGGGGPATATSPPRLTRTPQPSRAAISAAALSAANAFAVAPRSNWMPAGTVSRAPARSSRSSRMRRQPGAGRVTMRTEGPTAATA